MAGLLIRNIDWILTMDPQRRMIRDGAITLSGNRISYVGPSAGAPAVQGEIIDGRGLLAIPGLIDASVASVQHLGRGAGDGCDIPRYRLERTLALEGALSAQDARSASLACQLEMIHAGTTTFVDSGSRFPEEVAHAAMQSGLRAVVPRACYDVEETFVGALPAAFAPESTADTVRLAVKSANSMQGNAHPAIAIPWLGACTDELLKAVARVAEEMKLRVILGAGFARDDAVASRREHHATEIARLASAGLLGPRSIVSHAGWISPRDMRTLVDSGASVACCPATSHRLGTGALEYGRYPELREFGLNVALGSGSAMAGNHVDLVRQLFQYCGSNMSLRLDATAAPPESALEMATLNGARALGLESEIGSLAEGRRADIALFQTLAADWVPLHNPIGNLAFSARGGADTVFADGVPLMLRGRVTRLDETAILDEVQKRADALMDRTELRRFCQPAWPIQ
jgi:5-methylthioadenosine/S-adenosylhomocysteine deaminase